MREMSSRRFLAAAITADCCPGCVRTTYSVELVIS